MHIKFSEYDPMVYVDAVETNEFEKPPVVETTEEILINIDGDDVEFYVDVDKYGTVIGIEFNMYNIIDLVKNQMEKK